MDTKKIRDAFLNAPEKTEDILIPEWLKSLLEPDTRLAFKDIPSDLINLWRKQFIENDKTGNGQANLSAALFCKALINAENGEPIFEAADRDMIVKFGMTRMQSLYDQLSSFLGFGTGAVADAKKNSTTMTKNSGTTSLPSASLTPASPEPSSSLDAQNSLNGEPILS